MAILLFEQHPWTAGTLVHSQHDYRSRMTHHIAADPNAGRLENVVCSHPEHRAAVGDARGDNAGFLKRTFWHSRNNTSACSQYFSVVFLRVLCALCGKAFSVCCFK